MLTADEIAAKTNGYGRGELPLGANHVTAFIDVQQKLLYWLVAAWEDDFTGYVIDYGTWPDQKRRYFTLREVRRTLATATPEAGLEGQIYAGLERLCGELLPRKWRRDDGADMQVERCLIDANWGQSTDVVYQFCRQTERSAVVMPAHGRFVGASSTPFSEYRRRRGDRIGHHWRIPNVQGRRQVRHVLTDTNHWKSFVQERLAVPMGDPGSLSLFGRKPEAHQLLADHLTAEFRTEVQAKGRVVDEWKLRPGAPDNHWLDCLVGCAVAASMAGATLAAAQPVRQQRRERVRLSKLQRGR
jgi:phage terminase large subunit GpA-like protein